MNDFDQIYDKMMANNSDLEAYLSALYNKEGNSEMVISLAEILINQLKTQIDFTEMYCTDDIKNTLLNNLNSKVYTIEYSLEQKKTK